MSEQTFVEDRADHQRTPYLFNGKELDACPPQRSVGGKRLFWCEVSITFKHPNS